MLSEEDVLWLVDIAKRLRKVYTESLKGDDTLIVSFDERMAKIKAELERPTELLELLIHCPRCKEQHIDKGRFTKEPHKVHACQFCGLGFVACKLPSIGVQFFNGWKGVE